VLIGETSPPTLLGVAALPKPAPSSHPVDVGTRTKAIIAANQRYDLVLDIDGSFARVQCKTGRLRNGCVNFSAQSVRANTRKVNTRPYKGEIEMFLVYCPETDRIYAIPIDEATSSQSYLRIAPTANGQGKGVRWARDYELPA
jgi:hypothetical protein